MGPTPYTEDEVRRLLSIGKTYIAYLDGQPVGIYSLLGKDERIWGDQPIAAIYLHRIALGKSAHGKGIGQLLLDKAIAQARDGGCQFLRLDCDEYNTNLCQHYEKYGFTKVGSKAVHLKDSTYTAALYERKL